ncbi:MAG: TIGR00730 family Rossman fold protein [Rickettsiales bacterium]|jgi:uncharacterized protein (TIGR00730 family)|nr:TIGR00730 family Rossman fold protein [Rickettsiales bacterium]
MKQKSMAVYCGHQFGNNADFKRDAVRVGQLMAKDKIKLVFGGGDVGLMGAVATAVAENGGKVIGVSTEHVSARQEPLHEHTAIEIEIVKGVNERKQRMYGLSDAFCILPGGIGTLNELTDIMTMQQIGESKKPIYFLNTAGYWDIFGHTMTHMMREGFVESFDNYNIQVFNTPEEVLQEYLKYKA